jgi:hypothetical protein
VSGKINPSGSFPAGLVQGFQEILLNFKRLLPKKYATQFKAIYIVKELTSERSEVKATHIMHSLAQEVSCR